jgi:hypothetical protein
MMPNHLPVSLTEVESADPIAQRYQGGVFCIKDYDRHTPSSQDIFGWMRTTSHED